MGWNDLLQWVGVWLLVSQGGRVGVWILMLLIVLGVVGGCVFVLVDEGDGMEEQIEGVGDVVIVVGGMGRRSDGNKLRKESLNILGVMVVVGLLEKERGGVVNRSDSDRMLRGDEDGMGVGEVKRGVEYVDKLVGELFIIKVFYLRNRKLLRMMLLVKQYQRQWLKLRWNYWGDNDGSGEMVVGDFVKDKNVDNNNCVEVVSVLLLKKRR